MLSNDRVKTKLGLNISSPKKTKYIRPAIGVLIVLAVIGIALIGGGPKSKTNKVKVPQTACGPYRNDGIVKLGSRALKVEITKNSTEFDKGLAGRPCILPNQGMLFPFAKPMVIPMWMKGMNFPIDIIWISADHRVVAIEVDESPKTYPDKFQNKAPAQYVLEVKANSTKELGIGLGTLVNF